MYKGFELFLEDDSFSVYFNELFNDGKKRYQEKKKR